MTTPVARSVCPASFRDRRVFDQAKAQGLDVELNRFVVVPYDNSYVAQPQGSAADDGELHIDVVARGIRVRADLGELGLRQRAVLDRELDGEPEAARLARADRHRRGHLGLGGVLLLLLGDEIERPAEARGVAGNMCGTAMRGADALPGDYNNGEPEGLLTRDEFLDDITLYWLTNTATTAGRLYWETSGQSVLLAAAQKTADSPPVAITVFPEEVYRAPEYCGPGRRSQPDILPRG